MAFVEQRVLDDEFTVIRITADEDPAWAHVGGRVDASIDIVRANCNPNLRAIDDYFAALDSEPLYGPVGINFPVFVANLTGARTVESEQGGHWSRRIQAGVILSYCSTIDDDDTLSLTHSAAEHRADVLDTLEALACFALAIKLRARPGQLQLAHHKPLVDRRPAG